MMEEGGALLEDLDGWVLGCLEEQLSEDDAWQKLARVITTPNGNTLYSMAEMSRLKAAPSPAATLVRQLLQRGLSLHNLLQLLQQADLQNLHQLLAPAERASIISQSASGLLEAQYGGSVIVSVEVRGNPPPRCVWYKGNTPLLHHATSTLALQNCGPQDEGVYLCLVQQAGQQQGGGSEVGSEPSLELWSSPVELHLQHEAPTITEQPQPCTADWGQQVLLKCRCSSTYPPPSYSWFKDGRLLTTSDYPDLTVESCDLSSSGRYWCVACNSAGEAASQQVTVTVRGCSDGTGTPIILRQPGFPGHLTLQNSSGSQNPSSGGVGAATVSRGQPLQLWFSVRCALPVTFTWLRQGEALQGSSGPSHAVLSCREGDSSVYNSSLLYTPSDSDHSCLRILCLAASPTAQVASTEVVVQLKEQDLVVHKVYTARRKWALLVGNRRYLGKPLHTTLPDCQRLACSLSLLGYRCLVLADLSLTHFRNAVNLLAGFMQQGDYVVFYYGGHGYHSAGDHLIPTDGCGGEDGVAAGGCLSPVWLRNTLLARLPALLLLVLDMCRTALHEQDSRAPALVQELPDAARCSVLLHATAVGCAALEAPNSSSVLTRHLLHRLDTHAHQPLTALAAAVLQDVCGDSSRVREQQFPVLEADLALPRTLGDAGTAPAGEVVKRWQDLLSVGGSVTAQVLIETGGHTNSTGDISSNDNVNSDDTSGDNDLSADSSSADNSCNNILSSNIPSADPSNGNILSTNLPSSDNLNLIAARLPPPTGHVTGNHSNASATASFDERNASSSQHRRNVTSVSSPAAAARPLISCSKPRDLTKEATDQAAAAGHVSSHAAASATLASAASATLASATPSAASSATLVSAAPSAAASASLASAAPSAAASASLASASLASAAPSAAALTTLASAAPSAPTSAAASATLASAAPSAASAASRVTVLARPSLLGGQHAVANVAVVEVVVQVVGPPVLHRANIVAPGCRVLTVLQEGLRCVYRVEDLHCLTAPLVVVASLSPACPPTGTRPPPPRVVRLSLGFPGLAKTNLQLNDLRGRRHEASHEGGPLLGMSRLNIAP